MRKGAEDKQVETVFYHVQPLTVVTADQMNGPDCPQLHPWSLRRLQQRAKRMERPETSTQGHRALRVIDHKKCFLCACLCVCLTK